MKPGCCTAICRALSLLPRKCPCPPHSSFLLRCRSQSLMCSLLQRHYLPGLGRAQSSLGKSKSLFHRGTVSVGPAQCHLPMRQVQSRTSAVLIRQQHHLELKPVLSAPRMLSLSHSKAQSKAGMRRMQAKKPFQVILMQRCRLLTTAKERHWLAAGSMSTV